MAASKRAMAATAQRQQIVLQILREEPNLPYPEVARRIGVQITTVAFDVKELQRKGSLPRRRGAGSGPFLPSLPFGITPEMAAADRALLERVKAELGM